MPLAIALVASHASASLSLRSPSSLINVSALRDLGSSDDLSSSCLQDMTIVESNQALSISLKSSMEQAHKDLVAGSTKYCTAKQANDATTDVEISCIINYNEFTMGYQDECTSISNFNSIYSPVNLMLTCSYTGDEIENDGRIGLEMQLINIPSCVSQSCDAGIIYTALGKSLNSSSSSVFPMADSLDCRIDYDSIDINVVPQLQSEAQKTFSSDKEGGISEDASISIGPRKGNLSVLLLTGILSYHLYFSL
eukprot:CAMPEP_0194121798 /NCGR_PEP_ID=MMETSP0150-20130528/48493_1 /TAXON_ID=122233 /ORGANISM="Chaetoceros debilis, Strain MM31A-1" /LENGTH=251 /DNA_ID=CAMNT_0038814409 /DNA_START=130 /DNA_END=885 /DNA_ORIENTATION=+